MSTPYTTTLSHEDWQASKSVIERFLQEINPLLSPQSLDHNSSALIARLTHANPVLFIVRSDCINWDESNP